MKPGPLLVLFAVSLPVLSSGKMPAAEDEAFIPAEKKLSSYDALRRKSPFEFDAPKLTSSPTVDPFEGVSLAGYCGSGNRLTVYLLEGKEKKRITVFGDGSPFKKSDVTGYRVVGINRGRTLETTQVVLEKDGRRGTVKFEDETLNPAVGVQQTGPVIRGKDGKVIPRPVHTPAPVAPVLNNPVGSQVFIPGMSNATGAAPTGKAPVPAPNGAFVPTPNFRPNVPGTPSVHSSGFNQPAVVQPQGATGLQPQNTGTNKYQGRRRVVLPAQ